MCAYVGVYFPKCERKAFSLYPLSLRCFLRRTSVLTGRSRGFLMETELQDIRFGIYLYLKNYSLLI